MHLSNFYYQDIQKFKEKNCLPINCHYWHNDLVKIALEIGKYLFNGAEVEEANDGSIIVGLDNGKILALVCLPKQDFHASATLVGNTYFISISFSILQLLFNLSFSIWRNNKFTSLITPYFKNKSFIVSNLIPPGFEDIFLYSNFNFSGKIQEEISYKCFEQAICFFWLHEIAHVFLGHVDVCANPSNQITGISEFISIAKPKKKSLEKDENKQPQTPNIAFEIQADRWASDKIFERLHQKIRSSSEFEANLIAAVIGCTLFPLSLHGYNLLQGQTDADESHPPLWFRADEIIKSEDRAANQQWFSKNQEKKSFELRRSKQKDLIYSGLAGLSNLHPMFAEWVGPISELSRQAEAERILVKARKNLENWKESLLHYQHFPKNRKESKD